MDPTDEMLAMSASEWQFPFCPRPPDWSLDVGGIAEAFPWFRAMRECPQDPQWHAEGDVQLHTRLVCEALAASDEWRALPPVLRSVVFAATLMHDIAKPLCTREENGRITSRGHARRGAQMARLVVSDLDPDCLTPELFALREAVAALVRHHGLPLNFLDKSDPQRAVITASQTTRLDWLALLAEADVRGRECAGKAELLGRVELFREFARENDCLDHPYPFASDHSRFLYFHKPGLPPEHDAYDDTRCEVVLMSGLPGTGKNHWVAKNLPDWPVVSLDELRRQMRVDPAGDQGVIIQAAREQARSYLRDRVSFVWNATNTTRVLREQLVSLFHGYGARVRIAYLEAAPAEIARRNRSRGRAEQVPQAVLEKLRRRLDVPDRTEAQRVDCCIG